MLNVLVSFVFVESCRDICDFIVAICKFMRPLFLIFAARSSECYFSLGLFGGAFSRYVSHENETLVR